MRTSLRRHWPTLLISVATILALFLLTYTPPTSSIDPRSDLFQIQARSWLRGTWAVPDGVFESFEVNGKNYLYFGPVPSLVRLPFLLTPGGSGFNNG
ncbi:MAG: hypothetical protein ABI165_18915, partial [Bryobacteraceae bacterium]